MPLAPGGVLGRRSRRARRCRPPALLPGRRGAGAPRVGVPRCCLGRGGRLLRFGTPVRGLAVGLPRPARRSRPARCSRAVRRSRAAWCGRSSLVLGGLPVAEPGRVLLPAGLVLDHLYPRAWPQHDIG